MKKLLTLAIATAFSQNFILAQTATLSEPLQSFSILSGTSVTSKQITTVEGSVGAIGTVDSTVRAIDTTLQGSVCVTQRALDSFNVVRNRLRQMPAQNLGTNTLSNATLTSGTYKVNSSLTMSGTITLTGDSTSVYVFNVDRSLTFDANTQLILSGGVKSENVFFNVDSSVKILDSAVICGNILADGTICCSKDISATGARLMSSDSVCLINTKDTLGIISDRLVVFGGTCGCTIDLGQGDTCANNITMSDSVIWFKFVADSQRVKITVNGDSLSSVMLYAGTCNNLQLIFSKTFSDTFTIDTIGFVVGNTYYLRIQKDTASATTISSLCIKNLTPWIEFCATSGSNTCCTTWIPYITPCPTSPCFKYCAGQSITFALDAFSQTFVNSGSCGSTSGVVFLTPGASPASTSGLISPTSSWTVTYNTPGTYMIEAVACPFNGVDDSGGFLSRNCVTITILPRPAVDAGPNQTVCFGSCVTIGGNPTASGGTGPYTYSWSPSTGLSCVTCPNPVSCPQVTTTYTVIVTNVNGCSASDQVTVTVSPAITITIGPAQTICNGTCATITASATGGTPPLTYTWSGPSGIICGPSPAPSCSSVVVCPTTTTGYTFTVTDAAGCKKTNTVLIIVFPKPIVNAGPDQTICSGCQNGSANLTATVSSGTSPYTFSWSPSTGLNNPNISNPIACPTATTNYTVTVTDSKGCKGTDVVTVFVKPLPTITVGSNQSVCNNGCVTLSASSSAGNYSWSPSTGLSCTSCSNPVACVTATTNYTVTTTGANGCTASATVTVTLNPSPTANAGPDKTICGIGNCVTLNGSGGGTYAWLPATGLSCTNCSTPQACPATNTTYTLTVTNGFGCTSSDVVNVTVGNIPVTPVIAGNPNDCNTLTASTYSVSNTVAGVTYSWAASGGTIVPPATGANVSVNWNLTSPSSLPCTSCSKGPGSLTVTATNSSGCSSTGALLVFPCCKQYAGVTLFDASNTSVLAVASTYSVFGSGPPFTVTNFPFTINGTFTVNANINFINCKIDLSPDSKIVINPGASLTLTSSGNTGGQTILRAGTCCSVMWDGIYITGNTAHLITNSTGALQTTIQDAKNAVVSNNGGDYQITNTLLQRNNIDIVVNPYSLANTSTIKKSTLKTGTTPLLPYIANSQCKSALLRTNIGVQINTVAGIQIGVATLGNTNTFDIMDYGIYSTTSKITVYNNTFQNITFTSLSPLNGIGVYALGGKFLSPPPMGVTVGGGSANQPNTFTNCSSGVWVQRFMPSTKIDNNIFNNNFLVGSAVITCPSSTIDISSNTFNNGCAIPLNYAIACTDAFNSTTTIFKNTIAQTCTTLNGPTTGIYVANGVLPNMNLTIQDNTISNPRTGIWMINVSGPVAAMPLAVTNTITISKQGSFYTAAAPHYGIRLQGCSNVKVKQNTITQNAVPAVTPTFAMTKTLLGINVENSLGCIVGSSNTITKFGSGGYIYGNCNPSTLACNNLNSCYYGFNFDGPLATNFSAAVGDQIRDASLTPRPTANVWTGSINSDLGGFIQPTINWFENNPSPPTTVGLAPLSLVGNAVTVTGNNDICYQFKIPAQAQRGMLRSIVAQQNNYVSLTAQNLTLEHKFALKTLRENPQWMHQNNPDDTLFQNFYARMMASNLGKLGLINDTIANGHINDAININNTIIDTNALNANRKTVNLIYLSTWAQGILSFSSADSATLYSIAIEEPLEFGDAVYSARVMLGIDPNNAGNRIREDIPVINISKAKEISISKVYPNPNDGTMQINYSLEEGQIGKLIIYDLTGRKLNTYSLQEGEHNTLKISEGALKNGVYFYEIIVNGEMIEQDKIVIIK